MSGARSTFLTAILAVAVAAVQRGLVGLVEASGARDQPAVVLILLLSAFLGLLIAVVVRSMRLAGALAPTSLVLGWIVVPALLRAIPSSATQYFAADASLTAANAVALAVAVLAAAVTLGVQPER
jgi:transcriptional regulator GlxA family with amidase domain